MTCGSTQSGGCNKNPASFPAGQVRGLREQRELRTADRVLILRQRSASGKTPGGPATASAKKPAEWPAGKFAFRTAKRAGHHLRALPQVVTSIPQKWGVQSENAAAVPRMSTTEREAHQRRHTASPGRLKPRPH